MITAYSVSGNTMYVLRVRSLIMHTPGPMHCQVEGKKDRPTFRSAVSLARKIP